MKKTGNIEEMSGLRQPTEKEISEISEYMKYYYGLREKTCTKCSVFLGIFGIVMILASSSAGIFALVIGVVCFLGAFAAIRYEKQIIKDVTVIENGEFQVLDGYVKKIEADMDTPGVSNVIFESIKQQECKGWFSARHENLNLGLPLLLMYVAPDKVKGGICRVFTPYMLTKEGRKHPV